MRPPLTTTDSISTQNVNFEKLKLFQRTTGTSGGKIWRENVQKEDIGKITKDIVDAIMTFSNGTELPFTFLVFKNSKFY